MNTEQRTWCCRLIPDSPSECGVDQLLNHMIVTDYYDGPASGFLRCSVCASVYFFTTVAWSRNSFKRVIALASVPEDSWSKLISFFDQVPSGRQWIPPLLSRPTEQELDRIEAFLESITSKAERTSFLLAWDVISTKGLATRRVEGLPTPAALNMFNPRWSGSKTTADWFADIGVTLDL